MKWNTCIYIFVNCNNNNTFYLDFATPEEVYSSMVSDLRQTCPIDRLSLTLANSSMSHVYRYIVETHPSSSVCFIVFNIVILSQHFLQNVYVVQLIKFKVCCFIIFNNFIEYTFTIHTFLYIFNNFNIYYGIIWFWNFYLIK